MSDRQPTTHLFDRLVIAAGAAFVITCLALLAGVFSESRSPLVAMLDAYAGWILAAEAVTLVVAAWMAMRTDRRRWPRAVSAEQAHPAGAARAADPPSQPTPHTACTDQGADTDDRSRSPRD